MIPTAPTKVHSTDRTIRDLILKNVEQQRIAVDILKDVELADLFAAATTHIINDHLFDTARGTAVCG